VVVFPADVVYVNRGVVHPTDHYKNQDNALIILDSIGR
jgi:hypothetical protein